MITAILLFHKKTVLKVSKVCKRPLTRFFLANSKNCLSFTFFKLVNYIISHFVKIITNLLYPYLILTLFSLKSAILSPKGGRFMTKSRKQSFKKYLKHQRRLENLLKREYPNTKFAF